ncbi:type II toxin-antitoxin system VapC family toxin [Gordonia insulae]|uniref:Ribonuclease VapC n=1 Tax=Gordonia insulae TaxID=2420509 RepID=A0A3G8JMV5_9ACTN|nr:type II toxin-antitoxin system VapC family toxin [Gordonia insulae]AZG46323.1 Ribonuclease VapC40 [Gordonia insulae]
MLDTSAAIGLVRPGHEGHDKVRAATRGRRLGLSGHAKYEMYSVLTRLPPPQRLTAAAAARLISANFPHECHLTPEGSRRAIERFAALGISGGAVYDGLVGAAAADAGLVLLSLDRRAESIYRALGVRLEML